LDARRPEAEKVARKNAELARRNEELEKELKRLTIVGHMDEERIHWARP